MTDRPLVSVIMPFLDAAKFIHEAIESIFAQTYDNWELFLVDDGSTDASTEIARSYAQRYPEKVRYLEHQGHHNRGISFSRNLGISHAKGQYVAMLDADDVWLPQKLERQVAILQAYPEACMTYGPSQWWYSWTGNTEDRQRDNQQGLGMTPNQLIKPPTLLTLFLQQEGVVPCPSATLARLAAIERVGGLEDSAPNLYDDQTFYAKLCLEGPAFVDSECYCLYRRHPDAVCIALAGTGQAIAARHTFLKWLEAYTSSQQVWDKKLWGVLHEKLWPYRHPVLHHLAERTSYHINQMVDSLKLLVRLTLPGALYQWLKVGSNRTKVRKVS